MKDTKPFYLSLALWGAAITAFSLLFPNIYLKLGITDQPDLAAHIVAAIGTVITIVGRFRAKAVLTVLGKPIA